MIQYTDARRYFLNECRLGLGKIAMASLCAGTMLSARHANAEPPASSGKGLPGLPHYPAKVKRVIYLFMAGAPSQLDLFDYKPKLAELEGKPLPPSVIEGQRYAFIQPNAAVLDRASNLSVKANRGWKSLRCFHTWLRLWTASHCCEVYRPISSITRQLS